MTQTFSAQIDAWVLKTERRQQLVLQQSTNDIILRASRTSAGVTRGGVVRKGFIPRDLGGLAASLVSTLSGSTILTGVGEDSYSLIVAQMTSGDTATFTWTAPYARRLHYENGWMWVDEAAQRWVPTVRSNVAKAKAIYP